MTPNKPPSAGRVPPSHGGSDGLTPLRLLERARRVFADRLAVLDGERRFTYAELATRATRLAGALRALDVGPGDRVSVLSPNTTLPLEAHFGVPAAGAVLNALNTRLSIDELAYIVGHAGTRVLLADASEADRALRVADAVGGVRVVVDSGPGGEYDRQLHSAEPFQVSWSDVDERSLIAINYTSGTTGRPKGVMYSHRGAHLQALAMIAHSGLGPTTVFLWTLPMFHCNGWCFPWAVTGAGGVHMCLRRVSPDAIWAAVREAGANTFNAAPTVLADFAAHESADRPAPHPVRVATGGSPPAPALLARLAALNVDVTHLYGMTETYGPIVLCEWRPEWSTEPNDRQAVRKARQGVPNVLGDEVRVINPDGSDVPADGSTTGEIVVRGNAVMAGYFRDPEATQAAVRSGWLHTGDIAVVHPDNYLEIRDRAKDVIISGGENIASIEVEHALAAHPDVLEAAVVAQRDERWGEVPVGFVTLRPGASPDERDLIDFVRGRLAHFKAPRHIVFGPLPKTGTGKVQKFVLRQLVEHEDDPATPPRGQP